MNIVFRSRCSNLGIGSYRIWIHDLRKYWNELGIKSEINCKVDRKTDVLATAIKHSIRAPVIVTFIPLLIRILFFHLLTI